MSEHPTHPPSLFAVWTLFEGWPQWLWAKGVPPTVVDANPTRQMVRLCLLLGFMGLASSAAGAGVMAAVNSLFAPADWGLFVMPGVAFGMIVLVPVSRWHRRWWLTSLLSIAVSTVAYYSAMTTFLMASPPMGPSGLDEWQSGIFAGGVGATIVGLWMGFPTSWQRLGEFATIVTAGLTGGWLFGLLWDSQALQALHDVWPGPLQFFGKITTWYILIAPFQILVAIALGMRWWWHTAERHSPEDPLNEKSRERQRSVSAY
jgi:hypothetical protein